MMGAGREPMEATTFAEFAKAIRFVSMLRTGQSVAGGFFSFIVFLFRWCFVEDRKIAPDMALHPSEFAFVFRHPDSFAHFIVAENGQAAVDGRFVGLQFPHFLRQYSQHVNGRQFFLRRNQS